MFYRKLRCQFSSLFFPSSLFLFQLICINRFPSVVDVFVLESCVSNFFKYFQQQKQLMQAGMGTHFPSTGFSPTTPTVGPESLSVAVAVKNAINDPLLSLKPDANTQQQQQPNISATHVRYIRLKSKLPVKFFVIFRHHHLNTAQ